MTIKDRFLKQWRKNFEEFTPPELSILQLEIPERESVTSTGSEQGDEGNSEAATIKLNALQEDLEHTHDLIFKIRNELKRAKFCQSWLQREFTRCRKHSEQLGSITTPEPSGSDLDEEDDVDTPFVEEDQQEVVEEGDEGSGSQDGAEEEDDVDDDDDEPLYMNLSEVEEGVAQADDSDSDHDYEYLYDNTPFVSSHAGRVPPGVVVIPQHNGRPSSPDHVHREPRSPPPSTPPPDFNLSRTHSVDTPHMTTSDRLTRPTLALPHGLGMDNAMPAQLIAEAQRKRFSANYSNLSPVDMDSGAFSMDSCSISPSISSSDDKDSTSPDFIDGTCPDTSEIRRPSDVTLVLSDTRSGNPKPTPPARSNSLPHHESSMPGGRVSGIDHRLSTPEVEDLNIRRMLLNGILESEKKYIKLMEELLKMMKNIKLNIQTTQPILSMEDYDIIFFKIPELTEIHRRFCNHMEPKLQKWTTYETYGDSFKLLASNFGVHEEYVANYKKCMEVLQRQRQENPAFAAVAQQTVKLPTGEMVTLEAMLHSPLQRITKLTLVLDDLLKRTPQSHEDYGILYQVHEKTKKFMAQVDMATKDVNPNIKHKRQVKKQSYLVEFHDGERKIRHVLLYSDLIICAKEKTSSGMFQSRAQYDCQWYMPITELSLTPNEHSEPEQKITQMSDTELDGLKKEISDLKASIRRDLDPNVGSPSSPPLLRSSRRSSKQNRALLRNVAQNKKKLGELEAILILQSPKMSFHLYHHQGKTYTFLLSSDYERSDWKEAILSTKRECRSSPNLTPYHIEKLVSRIRRDKQINAVGSVLIKDDSELLFGQLHITVHKAKGLPVPSQLYCCIEVDSYGIFFLLAKTKTSQNSTVPTWEQTFDFEVDGAQKLRILVYDYTKGLDDEMYDKGAMQLERSKLTAHAEKFPLKMDRIELEVSLRFQRQDKILKRVMSKRKQGVFGVRLAQLAHRESTKIPHIVMHCVEEVERRGMTEMGIYRISGSSGDINNLKKAFEMNQKARMQKLIKSADIHAVAGLLKLYFRELPEPLFTHNLYSKFVDGLALKDPEAKRDCMMSLLKSIPDVNRHTIFHIFNHLRRVASHASENKMSLNNLSTVFGPTLIGPAVSPTSSDVSMMNILGMSDVMSQVGILYYYLEHFSADGGAPQKIPRQTMSTDL
ncbi:active breakpoint cluster region-related protein-like isoform X2 [Amphiura filiformis]|uniref:active breakpoint cluster region-related protein-like isoform X2 n=1 Tax=Amphiura filiformis TaxID=82378 RepID=UPI003B20D49A